MGKSWIEQQQAKRNKKLNGKSAAVKTDNNGKTFSVYPVSKPIKATIVNTVGRVSKPRPNRRSSKKRT